jgi:hypothetical protein
MWGGGGNLSPLTPIFYVLAYMFQRKSMSVTPRM